MPEKTDRNQRITLMLLQESIWKIEDKMNIILESIADHEAELIRLKRLINLSLERLGKVETQRGKNTKRRAKNE